MYGIKNFENEIDQLDFICRPANLPESNPGKDHLILNRGNVRVGLFTVLGRSFMGPKVSCPFATADRIINDLKKQDIDHIIQKFMQKPHLKKNQ